MASYQVGVIMIGSLNLIEFFVGMGFFEQAAGHGDRNGLVELTVDKQQRGLDLVDQRQAVVFNRGHRRRFKIRKVALHNVIRRGEC